MSTARRRVEMYEDGDIVIHVQPGYDYWIEKRRLKTIADAMDLMEHISHKGWPDMDSVMLGLRGRLFAMDCTRKGHQRYGYFSDWCNDVPLPLPDED